MTPPDPQQVAEIAGRLSKAQRRVVAAMTPGHWHSRYDGYRVKQPGSVMRHLAPKGLTERDRADENGAPYHRLTALGLAVRNFIQGNHHDYD